MSLVYLWKNREQPPFFSKRWFKVFAKRGWHTFGLISIILKQKKYRFFGATIGELSILNDIDANGSVKNLSIGRATSIGNRVHFALHNKIIIGNCVTINNDVKIFTASHNTKCKKWLMFSKQVTIKDYSWIASNAIILPGVVIGIGAVVGAGSVVVNNVPDYAVVAGNPAKTVSTRCTELEYLPVAFCAPFEAWLGIPTK